MSLISSAVGVISLTDNIAGSTTYSKQLNSVFSGDLSTVAQTLPIGTSPVTISVPNTLAQFLYIKNLSSTAGSNISVTWTPSGGSSEVALILDPGGVLIFSENGVNGVIALSLVSNVANTSVEFFLVG